MDIHTVHTYNSKHGNVVTVSKPQEAESLRQAATVKHYPKKQQKISKSGSEGR